MATEWCVAPPHHWVSRFIGSCPFILLGAERAHRRRLRARLRRPGWVTAQSRLKHIPLRSASDHRQAGTGHSTLSLTAPPLGLQGGKDNRKIAVFAQQHRVFVWDGPPAPASGWPAFEHLRRRRALSRADDCAKEGTPPGATGPERNPARPDPSVTRHGRTRGGLTPCGRPRAEPQIAVIDLSENSRLHKCICAPQAPELGQISSTKTTTSSRRAGGTDQQRFHLRTHHRAGRAQEHQPQSRRRVSCARCPSSGRRPAGKWRWRARPGGRPPKDRPHTASSPVRRPERRCRSGGGGNTRALWSHARFKARGPSQGEAALPNQTNPSWGRVATCRAAGSLGGGMGALHAVADANRAASTSRTGRRGDPPARDPPAPVPLAPTSDRALQGQ
eukprot:gene21353-biopygen5662